VIASTGATMCQACQRPFKPDNRPVHLFTADEADPAPRPVATYCRRCWLALSESLRVLESVIRA
jgi:hypothetical protein